MQTVELIDRYDVECVSASDKVGFIQDAKTDKACTRTITVSIYACLPRKCGSIQPDNFYRLSGSRANERTHPHILPA
jgi:hypothetical protein